MRLKTRLARPNPDAIAGDVSVINSLPAGYPSDWRVIPTALTESEGRAEPIIAAMRAGEPAPWIAIAPAPSRPRTLALAIPQLHESGMVAFEIDSDTDITWTITYRESFNSTNGADGTWSDPVNVSLLRTDNSTTIRLQKHNIAAGRERWIKLAFSHNLTSTRYARELSVFEFDPDRHHDYFIAIGASLTSQTLRQNRFRYWMKTLFDRDAVVFNEGVTGWDSEDLADNIAAIIARHPRARYALFEIGGNDVTGTRPFGSATQTEIDTIRSNLETVSDAMIAAGIIPIFSRISYRNYPGAPAVNGLTNQENGSLPYNEGIIDPFIRDEVPFTYDGARGMVDPYTFFLHNRHLLDTDGIHPLDYGKEKWNELWAKQAGGLIYRGRAEAVIDDDTVNGGAYEEEHAICVFFTASVASVTINDFDNTNPFQYNQLGFAAADHGRVFNTSGRRCPIGIEITDAFDTHNNTGVTNGTESPYPDELKIGAAVTTGGQTSTIRIYGLSPDATYALTMFASRSGTGTRNTLFTETVNTETVEVNALGNASTTVQLTGLAPNADGELFLDVEAGSGGATFGYLNVLEIERE